MASPTAKSLRVLIRVALCVSLAGGWSLHGTAYAAETDPPSLAVIVFELVDDQPDPARAQQLQVRLGAIKAQLEQGLQTRGLYRIVDTAPARDLIDAAVERHTFVHRCNGCLDEIGARLGSRLVAVGWVQRVSELILNINVSVREAQTDREVLVKSVDLRGNTEDTWARGVNFMLRDWAERRERNPRYGQ